MVWEYPDTELVVNRSFENSACDSLPGIIGEIRTEKGRFYKIGDFHFDNYKKNFGVLNLEKECYQNMKKVDL